MNSCKNVLSWQRTNFYYILSKQLSIILYFVDVIVMEISMELVVREVKMEGQDVVMMV